MNKKHATSSLLILDDADTIATDVTPVADRVGFSVSAYQDLREFLDAAASLRPVVVLINLVMKDTDGVEVIRKLSEQGFKGKVCIFAGDVNEKVVLTVYRLGNTYGLDMAESLRLPIDLNWLENLLRVLWKENYAISRDDLVQAIEDQEITLFYQPKVHFDDDGNSTPIDEVEALARWIHPELGMVSPGNFIPLAEQSGLIGKLTDLVIEQALRQIDVWHGDGLDLQVGVNLSLYSLDDVNLPDALSADCARFGVDPHNLILEITETAAMGNSPVLPDILSRLRLKGFELAMDDFGTGYSSLVQLYRMPFSELKIDQSFLMESDKSEEARIIIRSIMNLAQNLGLSSCAEGVETATAVDFCRSIGCKKLQGYFISKPLPAEDLTRFINHWDPDLGLLTH